MDEANDISIVYANDTVDFGTVDFDPSANKPSAKKDDGTHIGSDSCSDTGDGGDGEGEGDESKTNHPQHAENNKSSNFNTTDLNFYEDYMNTAADSLIIDNRKLVYIPIRLACGICANCSPDVLKHCPMVLRSVQADLSKAFSVLPVSVHSLLRRTNLWLNYNGYAYGTKANPRILRHMTTHHHPAWLVEWACDTPQKAMGIEIYSCVDFQKMRLHWNGSGLFLHEFCHLIHQCCLEDGLENRTVEALYEKADASGRYEKVLRRDWAGKTKTNTITNGLEDDPQDLEEAAVVEPADFDLAYAMVDPKEFFAELSVAYFCHAYRSLDKADPNVMEACSPPLLHPEATERIESLASQRQRERASDATTENYYQFLGGNKYQSIGNNGNLNVHTGSKMDRCADVPDSCCWAPFPPVARFVRNMAQRRRAFLDEEEDPQLSQWFKLIDPVFRERAMSRNCASISHCNKFYPFTHGQLKHHDPELFRNLRDLWREIAMWEDPFASIRTRKRMSRSCARRCPNLFFPEC